MYFFLVLFYFRLVRVPNFVLAAERFRRQSCSNRILSLAVSWCDVCLGERSGDGKTIKIKHFSPLPSASSAFTFLPPIAHHPGCRVARAARRYFFGSCHVTTLGCGFWVANSIAEWMVAATADTRRLMCILRVKAIANNCINNNEK